MPAKSFGDYAKNLKANLAIVRRKAKRQTLKYQPDGFYQLIELLLDNAKKEDHKPDELIQAAGSTKKELDYLCSVSNGRVYNSRDHFAAQDLQPAKHKGLAKGRGLHHPRQPA